MIAKSWIKAD